MPQLARKLSVSRLIAAAVVTVFVMGQASAQETPETGFATNTLVPSATPRFAATNTPNANWVNVGEEGAFLRSGPGQRFPVVGFLDAGALVEPVSRDIDNGWVLIRTADGFAWISRTLVQWIITPASLPVLVPGALTPSPTFTQSRTATRTSTITHTPTVTASATRTATATPTRTSTPTLTASFTMTATATHTPTLTPSLTPTLRPTQTASHPATQTAAPTDIQAPTSTRTARPTRTPLPQQATATIAPSATASETPSHTPVATRTRTQLPLTNTLTPSLMPPTATNTAVPPTETVVLPTETRVPPTATDVPPTETVLPTQTAPPTQTSPPTLSNNAATATRIVLETAVVNTMLTQTAQALVPIATDVPTDEPSPTNAPSTAPVMPTEAPASPTASSAPEAAASGTPALIPAQADGPTEQGGGVPLEAVIAVIALAGVVTYAAFYWRGVTRSERFSQGFVIDQCPACETGTLVPETRTGRVLGIPRPTHTIRCTNCRSVLREVGEGEWRYAVDPLVNQPLYQKWNNKVIRNEQLAKLHAVSALKSHRKDDDAAG
ncbi:MAG: SH3 domain-containing protein [Pleurocapsa minor GSE-CHR-MK-17-07R]|jgi:hypothetical protein|nr:SH3 domain-containing protein [Pleurocapsa minor GSE-CHR-MK 17-07R]